MVSGVWKERLLSWHLPFFIRRKWVRSNRLIDEVFCCIWIGFWLGLELYLLKVYCADPVIGLAYSGRDPDAIVELNLDFNPANKFNSIDRLDDNDRNSDSRQSKEIEILAPWKWKWNLDWSGLWNNGEPKIPPPDCDLDFWGNWLIHVEEFGKYREASMEDGGPMQEAVDVGAEKETKESIESAVVHEDESSLIDFLDHGNVNWNWNWEWSESDWSWQWDWEAFHRLGNSEPELPPPDCDLDIWGNWVKPVEKQHLAEGTTLEDGPTFWNSYFRAGVTADSGAQREILTHEVPGNDGWLLGNIIDQILKFVSKIEAPDITNFDICENILKGFQYIILMHQQIFHLFK